MMANVTIDHGTYKQIKHYDRAQMAKFCENLYMQGYNDAKRTDEGVDSEAVYAVIASVRGIGPKRLAAIKGAVDTAFKEKTK